MTTPKTISEKKKVQLQSRLDLTLEEKVAMLERLHKHALFLKQIKEKA